MNYEEKYKEALEWMRSIYPTMQGVDKEDAEHYFTELKESEDEKIRKELYDFITCQYGSIDDRHYHSWISWITKHKQEPVEQDTEIHDLWVYIREWNDKFGRLPKDEDELAACIDYVMKRQKPTDKVEPKFKVGDVITNKKSKDTVKIVQILHNSYCYLGWDGAAIVHSDFSISEQDSWELVAQKPAEWSEEDEKMYNMFRSMAHGTYVVQTQETIDSLLSWLKSIKPNHWKPSEEQIGALNYAYCELFKRGENSEGSNCVHPLMTLIDDLKKL